MKYRYLGPVLFNGGLGAIIALVVMVWWVMEPQTRNNWRAVADVAMIASLLVAFAGWLLPWPKKKQAPPIRDISDQ